MLPACRQTGRGAFPNPTLGRLGLLQPAASGAHTLRSTPHRGQGRPSDRWRRYDSHADSPVTRTPELPSQLEATRFAPFDSRHDALKRLAAVIGDHHVLPNLT